MIFDAMYRRFGGILGERFPEVVCLGPVILECDPREIAISPGVILGYPSLDSVRKLLAAEYEPGGEVAGDEEAVILSRGVVIGPFSTIHRGVTLQDRVFIEGRSVVRHGAIVAAGSTLYFGAYIGEEARIGANAKVGGFVCNRASVGADSAMFGQLVHKYPSPGIKEREPSPVIGDRVLVGTNAVVVGGIRVGDGARIAAGAVVLGDVPPGAFVRGLKQ